MNWQIIFDPAFSGRVCLVLAHSLWQFALVTALAWAIGRLGRLSVERSYVLHVTALMAGLVAIGVTYALVDVDAPAARSSPGLAAAVDSPSVPPAAFAPEAIGLPHHYAAPAVSPGDASNSSGVPISAPAAATVEEPSPLWLRLAPAMVALYALGVAVMLLRLVRGICYARRLGAAARPVGDAALVGRLDRLARQWSIRAAPALGWVEGIAVPKVIGLVRPAILLPMSAITCLSSDDLEMILAHELAHVRRLDMWINLLQRAAEVALFFNPALWYLSRRISTLREYCCDELACRVATGEPRTRYASALVRVAELSRLSDRQRVSVQALAADGRSPSDLRRRIARLMGETLDEPIRLSRGSLVAMSLAAALLLAAPTAWQSAGEPAAEQAIETTQESADETRRDETGANTAEAGAASAVEKAFEESLRVEMSIVIARHVLLLEGKEIVTWEELEKKIAALPDPSKAYPHFYITRGTYEAGGQEKAKEGMYRLHGKYKLDGHSEGSLWPRADLRYDQIKTAGDLVPDPSLRIEGRVVDGKGAPAAGAEVLLVTPVDESIPYKSVHIELVEGRVRNRLEQVMTLSDEEGRFALYPPKDSPFYIVVLHPKRGFALVRSEQFAKEREVRLLAWSELVTKLADEPGEQQEASIRTTVRAEDGYPEIIFNQYWVDLKRARPTDAFRYTHVPPIFATTISRDFPAEQGGSIGMPGATVDLLPGESRQLDLGPLSDKQREQLNWIREESRSRNKEILDDSVPAAGDSSRRFELRVIGPDGQPLPEASVQIRTRPKLTADDVRRGQFVSQGPYGTFLNTDAEGRLAVIRPESPDDFSLFVEQPGFGPYWAEWQSRTSPQEPPPAITAELEAAWAVGGMIVDREGHPVEGATIHPSIRYKKGVTTSTELHVGATVTSDENGRWSYASVPESMQEVFVEVSHPAYQPNRRALARSEFGLEAGDEPNARITLEAGLVVTGTVRDEAGSPIAGARVRTEFLNDRREATTADDGTYRLVGCEPRMASIVVSARGKALDKQEVRVEPGMKPVDFVMRPGGKIRVRVVDSKGKPVAKTRIFFQRWRGPIEYFEFGHVNQYTNEEGVWEWNEAPLDEIRADICPPDGMQLLEQPLVAREEEYVFQAIPPLVITGSVTDAATGQSVKSFRVVPGLENGPDLHWVRQDSFEATEGHYQLKLDRGYPAHLVRIEAVGYEVATSREIRSDEGAPQIDFALKRGRDVAATILTPEGKPAVGAKIALGIAGSQIMLRNGDIFDYQTYAARQNTDEAGRFRFPAQDGAFQLVITHPAGFAYMKSQDGPTPATVTLTPWARVEGTFRVGEKAISGVAITLNSGAVDSYGSDAPSVSNYHDVTTGPEGRFVFERVFPGDGRIGRGILLLMGEGATEVTSSTKVAARFKAGETTRIDLGGSGRPVVGKLAPPAGFGDRVLWNFALVEVEADLPLPKSPPMPPALRHDAQQSQEWWKKWIATEEGKAWKAEYKIFERLRSASPRFTASVDRDGSFRIDDMPAGQYILSVRFSEHEAGRLSGYKFSVPGVEGSISREPVDLGTLRLNGQ